MNLLAYIKWGISPDIFSIGPVTVRWYGLLFALGFILGYQIMQRIFLSEKRTQKELDSLTIYMVIGTVVGARLGHCLFYEPTFYLSHPLEILYVWKGGLASHGAAFGILIALWYYIKNNKGFTYLWILDRIVIVVMLAGFLIRLGNFFNSEILGSPANLPWAVIFTRVDKIPRHPAQLYEAFSYLITFSILWFIYKKRGSALQPGLLLGIFLTLVFGMRFILEFFKDVQVDFEKTLPLDMGQFLSIPFVIAGLYLLYNALKKRKTN